MLLPLLSLLPLAGSWKTAAACAGRTAAAAARRFDAPGSRAAAGNPKVRKDTLAPTGLTQVRDGIKRWS